MPEVAEVSAAPLWDAGRVAKFLGVRIHRVYELAAQDVIPTVRIGRQLRFSPSALNAWIQAGGKRAEAK